MTDVTIKLLTKIVSKDFLIIMVTVPLLPPIAMLKIALQCLNFDFYETIVVTVSLLLQSVTQNFEKQ